MSTLQRLSLRFLGAAGTVTGSKTLLKFNDYQVMVDCGLFQGLKSLRKHNWDNLEEVHLIKDVILTHAHLDHCGYIPRLVKQGFTGTIHCTPITAKLVEIILYDSAKIQMEDADRANRHHYSKHDPAKPLYTDKDVKQSLQLIRVHKPGEWIVLYTDLRFRFVENGHIPGSCMVELHAGAKRFVFSGDVGRLSPLIMPKPKQLPACDYLILESTYGDRLHNLGSPEDALADFINKGVERNAQILMPSFAVERAQEIIYLIIKLMIQSRIPRLRIFLDSPMATKVTQVLEDYYDFMNNPEFRNMFSRQLEVVSDYRASRAVVDIAGPKIVIAGSGMVTGGRILHHLAAHISNPDTLVILPGFQAPGTRGESLLYGASEIKFFGEYHEVNAEIVQMNSLSAHADRDELVQWVGQAAEPPGQIFLNHGEERAAESLRVKLESEFSQPVKVAQPLMNLVLDYDQRYDHEIEQASK